MRRTLSCVMALSGAIAVSSGCMESTGPQGEEPTPPGLAGPTPPAQARCMTSLAEGPLAMAGTTPLAFVRDGDIYAADPDGSGIIRLTTTGTFGQPAWSPDGRRLAIVENSESYNSAAIYLMNSDGSDLGFFGRGRSPVWSPDGRRIAFSAVEDRSARIFVRSVENDGTPTARIGFELSWNSDSPAWSPDGCRIAYANYGDFHVAIYIANADGSDVVQLTDFGSIGSLRRYTGYAEPSWSPDGHSLALVACTEFHLFECEVSSLGVVDFGGSGLRVLAETTGHANPTWSPDGSTITFARTCGDYRCPSAVFQIPARGGYERLLIEDGHSPAWAP